MLKGNDSVFAEKISYIYQGKNDASNTSPMAQCGENERYTTCSSSTCFEESCNDVLNPNPEPRKCTRDCRQGCQCKPGFYRNHDGRCVDAVSCAMCGIGEQWIYSNTDGAMTGINEQEYGCEITCEDVLMMPIDAYYSMDLETVDVGSGQLISGGGCYCAPGFYRNINGMCVSKDTCKSCGMNEIWEQCGSSSCWEYTCDDVGTPYRELWTRPCTLDCRQGCKCSPGFYREEKIFGECISAEFCMMIDRDMDDNMDDDGNYTDDYYYYDMDYYNDTAQDGDTVSDKKTP